MVRYAARHRFGVSRRAIAGQADAKQIGRYARDEASPHARSNGSAPA